MVEETKKSKKKKNLWFIIQFLWHKHLDEERD